MRTNTKALAKIEHNVTKSNHPKTRAEWATKICDITYEGKHPVGAATAV
jgi:hypothetical protein